MSLLGESEDYGYAWGNRGEASLPPYEEFLKSSQGGGALPMGKVSTGSGGYSTGAPLVFNNDIWNANVGAGSRITGGTRYGGSLTPLSYGGGSTSSYGTQGNVMVDASYAPVLQEYKRTPMPTYQSTVVTPDEKKIRSLTASGGGNALRASVSEIANRVVAASSAVPLAVQRQQFRQMSENIAGMYAKAMPSIRSQARNEWWATYGKPKSEDIAARNRYNMEAWLANEKASLAEYLARYQVGSKYNTDVTATQGLPAVRSYTGV